MFISALQKSDSVKHTHTFLFLSCAESSLLHFGAPTVAESGGYSLVAMHGLLIAMTFLHSHAHLWCVYCSLGSQAWVTYPALEEVGASPLELQGWGVGKGVFLQGKFACAGSESGVKATHTHCRQSLVTRNLINRWRRELTVHLQGARRN